MDTKEKTQLEKRFDFIYEYLRKKNLSEVSFNEAILLNKELKKRGLK